MFVVINYYLIQGLHKRQICLVLLTNKFTISKPRNMIASISIKQWLEKQPQWFFISYVIIASFSTYACMYAFRKPFTVATFENGNFLGIDEKIWFITAQVVGYTLSKFIGIKVISEMKSHKRAISILILILAAWVSLFLFGLVSSPYRIIFLFSNGLPLGMIWGLVFAYLEGRKFTELLGAGLSVSFIFASGVVKSVGKWVMLDLNVSEYWMPFATGLIFLLPLLISLYFLSQVPPPTAEDRALRTERQPMDKEQRKAFFRNFATAIVLLVGAYSILMIFREMRDNFAVEIWNDLGYANNPQIFTRSEIPVGLIALFFLGMVSFITSNIKALYCIIFMVMGGFLLIGMGSMLFEGNYISGFFWVVITGLGLYMAFIPFNALLFERMIATFRYTSNIGYVMYLADAMGYLSSIGIFGLKNVFSPSTSWADFFLSSSYFVSVAGIIIMIASALWLLKKYNLVVFPVTSKNYKYVTIPR